MSLALEDNQAKYQIRAFRPGFIQINEQTYTHSLIVCAEKLITDWPPQTITELTHEHLQIIVEMQPAILLIGTGASIYFPPLDCYGELINAGIGVEIMDTGAACRTYNILTAEGRHVIAALMIK